MLTSCCELQYCVTVSILIPCQPLNILCPCPTFSLNSIKTKGIMAAVLVYYHEVALLRSCLTLLITLASSVSHAIFF